MAGLVGTPGGNARCLVLGGTGFLGREVCRRLLALGARVAFTLHAGRAAAEGLCANEDPSALHAVEADLSVPASVAAAVDAAAAKLGGLDALVHCAAVGGTGDRCDPAPHARLEEIDAPAWDALMNVNLRSAFLATRRAAPLMREGGNIVFVGSMDGVLPVPSPVHYATSKAALGGLARSLAKELGAAGIRVNVVSPGVLAGGLSRTLSPRLREDYLAHCALARCAAPDEIASVVAFFAVSNSYVTGQTISVNGGL